MGTPSATVYVDYNGTPHTFIKLDDGNGNVNYYGFAPKNTGSMFGTGTVGKDLTTHFLGDPNNSKAGYIDDVAWSKTIPLTDAQYSAMDAKVKSWDINTPDYNVFGTNCTAFVKDVLSAGNANYPGISWGPNPFNMIPVDEQGPLFTTGIGDHSRILSDAVRDPANTPGTPAYDYKQAHPEMFGPTTPTPASEDATSYDLHQNADGTWTQTVCYSNGSVETVVSNNTPQGYTCSRVDHSTDAAGTEVVVKSTFAAGFDSAPTEVTTTTTTSAGDITIAHQTADGTTDRIDVYTANGGESHRAFNPDGSSSATTSDGQGNSTSTDVTAAGETTTTYHNADGSYGSSSSDGLGSSQSEAHGADGSMSHNWSKADGSSHHDATDAAGNFSEYGYATDGSYSSDYKNIDGSHGDSASHPDGSSLTESWTADGSFNESFRHADGSSGGDYKNADGSYGSSSSDGLGNSQSEAHGADDSVSHDWSKLDGSSHHDATDALGNSNQSDTATDGTVNSDYHHADGAHGDTVSHPDGSNHTEAWTADGSFSESTRNALARQAIAPLWKMQTAQEQAKNNLDDHVGNAQNGLAGFETSIRYQKHSFLQNQIVRYKAKRYSKPCANESEWSQVA